MLRASQIGRIVEPMQKLKHIHVNYIQKSSAFVTEITARLDYKYQFGVCRVGKL